MPDLARHFLDRATRDGLPRKDMTARRRSPRCRITVGPGNVRELENLIKRLIAIESDDTIGAASVERELASQTHHPTVPQKRWDRQHARGVLRELPGALFRVHGGSLPPPGLYERMLAEIEPPLLRASLAATNGNQLKAAALLGVNRNTLRSKLRNRNVKNLRLSG